MPVRAAVPLPARATAYRLAAPLAKQAVPAAVSEAVPEVVPTAVVQTVPAAVLKPVQAGARVAVQLLVREIAAVPAEIIVPADAAADALPDVRIRVKGHPKVQPVMNVRKRVIRHVLLSAKTHALGNVPVHVIRIVLVVAGDIVLPPHTLICRAALQTDVLSFALILVMRYVMQVVVILALIHRVRIMEIKKTNEPWKGAAAKSITFIVTKDCQLACRYCYLVGKNVNEKMSFEVAKKAVDYILNDRNLFSEPSVVFEFIGGEPFLEIELINKICDYLKMQMYLLEHPWFDSYRFNFSTNGLLYDDKRVQHFIKKNGTHISLGITIDGTERKHDSQRVYKNGKGSYRDVVKRIPLWLKQFPGSGTKVTIGSDDLPYITESVLHLYSLGIKEVNINCVFEDVWKEGDDLLLEEQLMQLADEIINRKLYEEYSCSFFSETIGKPMDKVHENQNWCGAGKMLSVDAAGNFYPCTRFAAYSLRSKKPVIIGNIHEGVNTNKLRPFLMLDRCTQSLPECIDCEVSSGCAWCQGENYDAADTATIYQRSTAICKMHKARVRANNYYWSRLNRIAQKENRKQREEALCCNI